jgi:uncharacterized protein YwqG
MFGYIPPKMQRVRRTTWIPTVRQGDSAPHASKFAGTPWLAQGEAWPECDNCGKPMPLFLQLNLDTLPEALEKKYGSGLLQLFYCTNAEPCCEAECDAFFAFTSAKLVRVIQPAGEPQHVKLPPEAARFPALEIIGWREDQDYPTWQEGLEYRVNLTDDEWEQIAKQNFPRSGDKLAGWPLWAQDIEYPNCPICHDIMHLVFQIDSEDHLPHMFGDAGCGHITQCPSHPDQVTFAWACG